MAGKSLVVYGEKLGREDLDNIRTYLDRNGYEDCRLILSTEPIPALKEELTADKRIQLTTSDRSKREAKSLAETLKSEGKDVKLARLEEVSDRSMDRGGC